MTHTDLDGGAEPHHTSGMTTRVILDYVEREGGRPAVGALFEGAGLAGLEDRLRDEDAW
ncbi:MAG: hypothetical protein ACR2LY_02725 [Thermoleophilaceae bacterium]